ncbi:macrophage mannose receptor 1-like isoform X2 [Colossoma macropomum]|uniref:macrophage mannose receptor 1-like isoform X2 n=1 Tax=Colossoma macropomum TaxID=42526 RepID=UPI001864A76F|nr:macrophage mannose receptor 1-like isoform X2 [Colossoma macropomum]
MDQKWISVFFLLSAIYGLSAYVPHRYHFVNENKTWIEAQSYCRQTYTDLATINNMDKMKKVTEIVKDKSAKVWIGLEKVTWQWSLQDGTVYREGQSYSNWNTGEPNSNAGEEMCVHIYGVGSWNDEYCSCLLPFVCFEEKGSAYILIKEAKSWHEARNYCRERYTDLVIVRNQTENQQIFDSAKNSVNNSVWIGLFNNFWRWADQSNSSFRYWASTQPDNNGGNQNCTAVLTAEQGRWHDVNGNSQLPFICHENQLILIKQNLTWREALRYCRDHHVDLVSVHSEEIQLWVKEVAQKASTEHVWLGLRHTCTQGFWYWVSGFSICYENWAPGNGTGGDDCSSVERTGAVQSRGGQQWVSLPEDQKLNFICTTYED